MFTAYVVVTALMSAILLGSAVAKFTRPQRLVEQMTGLGVPIDKLPLLGVAQIAGAGGLVVGIWWGPVGIAAAIGLTLYFVGAIATHLRARDFTGAPPVVVLAIVAAVLVGLRIAAR